MSFKNLNEDLYKNIAKKYLEKSAEELKNITFDESKFNYDRLDKKVYSKISKSNFLLRYLPATTAVASIIVFLFLFNGYANNVFTTPIIKKSIQNKNISFVSKNMPNKYKIDNIKFDDGEIVYHIVDSLNDDIVMVATNKDIDLQSNKFFEKTINNTKTYILNKSDYRMLVFEKDNVQYKLTSREDTRSLIEIANLLTS